MIISSNIKKYKNFIETSRILIHFVAAENHRLFPLFPPISQMNCSQTSYFLFSKKNFISSNLKTREKRRKSKKIKASKLQIKFYKNNY